MKERIVTRRGNYKDAEGLLLNTKNDKNDLRSRLVEAPGAAGVGDTGREPPSGLWDRVPIAYLSSKAQKVKIDGILTSNSILLDHGMHATRKR